MSCHVRLQFHGHGSGDGNLGEVGCLFLLFGLNVL